MEYQTPAAAMLRTLGYDRPVGREWLEQWQRDRQLSLPRVYCDFMELAADCPLLGTSNLWVGKMAHGLCVPKTVYEELQEAIDERQGRWSGRPGKYERALYTLSKLPVSEWPAQTEDYLLLGSDYAGGAGEFGIRVKDLAEADPAVYWRRDRGNLSGWKLENETLSGFLRGVLSEALACVDYPTAESALEEKGWRYEEYFDVKKDDWVASKTVLKRYGIDFTKLTRYRAGNGKVFCCYDTDRKVFFVGAVGGGEMSLLAVSHKEAEKIFLDLDSLEFVLEVARLCVKDQAREDEISPYYLYSKTSAPGLRLSDACYLEDPPVKNEQGNAVFPERVNRKRLYARCGGKVLLEVVAKTLRKKPKASNAELAAALNEALPAGSGSAPV